MAFNPGKQQQFYLIAKHSDLALTIDSSGLGSHIAQQAFNSDEPRQKFLFAPGNSFHWILLPAYHDRYVAVHASSQDESIPVICWKWEPHAPNLMFEFLPASDGYYRIMARHSNKFFDILNISKSAGGKLTQHTLNTADNQIFKPVAVAGVTLGANPMSYREIDEMIRSAVLGLIGLVPKAGGGIAFVVGLFWKSADRFSDIWEQVKVYIDVRVKELIRADKMENLRLMLKGMLKSLEEINESADKTSMGHRIYAAIDRILEKQYLYAPTKSYYAIAEAAGDEVLDEQSVSAALKGANDSGDIRDILPYFVGIGTILITLRRTIVKDHAMWFKEPASDAQKAINQRLLTNTIAEYCGYLAKGKELLMEWRMSKISVVYSELRVPPAGFNRCVVSYAQDAYDGWSVEWDYYFHTITSDVGGDPNHAIRAEYAVAQRRRQAREQFEAEMEELLSTSKYWTSLNPTEKEYEPKLKQREVGACGGMNTYRGFGGVDGKTIAKLVVHSRGGNSISGIEVFYKEKTQHNVETDGVSFGLVGATGDASCVLTLAAGEYINHFYGYGKTNLTGLWFSTNLGRLTGTGERASADLFVADIPDSFNPHLVKITGAYAPNNIEHLNFTWEYEY